MLNIKNKIRLLHKNIFFIYSAYFLMANILLVFLHWKSDLPIEISAWSPKVTQILSGHFPKSNFYGPGGAICLLPFAWLRPNYFIIVFIYFNLGLFSYFKICSFIPKKKFRIYAIFMLPCNFYLIWLCNSSQDTVFEFGLLSASLWAILSKKYKIAMVLLLILAETRSAYWVYFITFFSGLFLILRKRGETKYSLLIFPLMSLVTILFINSTVYKDPSPALEGGITEYFSYSNIQYLGLPKFDTDVFQSGINGIFSQEFGEAPKSSLTESESDRFYRSAALNSIKHNPKQVTLGLMEKIDAYIFDVQKVPYLPGSYVMDQAKKAILIGDERLRWDLILGNFAFEIWRSVWLIGFILTTGLYIFVKVTSRRKYTENSLFYLTIPWILGIIPGTLIYTETRFKVVSEVLVIPFIFNMLSKVKFLINSEKSTEGVQD